MYAIAARKEPMKKSRATALIRNPDGSWGSLNHICCAAEAAAINAPPTTMAIQKPDWGTSILRRGGFVRGHGRTREEARGGERRREEAAGG